MQTETKPFQRTSEFWGTMILQVLAALQLTGTDGVDVTSGKQNVAVIIAMGVIQAAYVIARGLAKQGQPYYGPPGGVPDYMIDEDELNDGDLDDDETPVKP